MCPRCRHPRHEHNKLGYCQHRMTPDGRCMCHEPDMSGYAHRPRRIRL
jgi:hypothetical protein